MDGGRNYVFIQKSKNKRNDYKLLKPIHDLVLVLPLISQKYHFGNEFSSPARDFSKNEANF